MNCVCLEGGGVHACDGCVPLPVCSFSGVLFFPSCESHTLSHEHAAMLFLCMLWAKKQAQEEREEGDERVSGVNLIPLGPNDMPKPHSGGLESLLSQILYSPLFQR